MPCNCLGWAEPARGRARCQSPKGGGEGGQNLLAQKGFSGRVVICSPVPALPLVPASKKRWTLFFADITHVSQLSHSFTNVFSWPQTAQKGDIVTHWLIDSTLHIVETHYHRALWDERLVTLMTLWGFSLNAFVITLKRVLQALDGSGWGLFFSPMFFCCSNAPMPNFAPMLRCLILSDA